ncbi:MAG: phenylalanine--tRNA ligase subunit alpha [Nitrososphaerota archaeon]|nr:phenylalanine--tRNA ligase subunit alpha [Nitrososphaerales archaeon]MDW8044430.1 phenylalanine--tRNA ligase subunit alpha [Nitrososphaerota archaeon]
MPVILHRLERSLLLTLFELGEATLERVASHSRLNIDQVRIAVEWLKSKGLIDIKSISRERVSLGEEGKKVLMNGLPERRLINALSKLGGRANFQELREAFPVSEQEFAASFGYAKEKGWIKISTKEGKALVELVSTPTITDEEVFLERLSKGDVFLDELSEEELKVLKVLVKRPNYLVQKPIKTVMLKLTPLGEKTVKSLRKRREIDALTPELLVSGKWKEYVLRPIDVVSPTPPIYPGKKHPVQRFIDEVREIFVSLGFEEVDGPLVQPCFWNFDALFTPQDHPAREMQDTFYLSKMRAKSIGDDRIVENVAKVHLNGGDTNSKGWGYRWSRELAENLVLRTHTTAVTVKYLADFRPSEARVFCVGRVFRNEKTTFKHLAEFHQIEGIVVGKNVTLRDLMGLLSCFYSRLGLKKVKFWPSYFPYTEPSLQSVVYIDRLGKWVELCGMGIFRPEVTLPLGVKNPVLAWGGGLERLVMLRYGIDDVRKLYENNLGWLRSVPMCL